MSLFNLQDTLAPRWNSIELFTNILIIKAACVFLGLPHKMDNNVVKKYIYIPKEITNISKTFNSKDHKNWNFNPLWPKFHLRAEEKKY